MTFTVDNGSEFKGSVNTLLEKYNIKKYVNDPESLQQHTHMAIVERFNRTLLNKINKYLLSNQTLTFINVLDDIIYNYNHKIHSTTQRKPIDIYKNKKLPIEQLQNTKTKLFKIGDKVRHRIKRKVFDKKGITPTYSLNVFTVKAIKGYKYELSNGRLYDPNDLQKVNNEDNLETFINKVKDNTKLNKQVRKQKQEPAFSDKNTHKINEEGLVKMRDYLLPKSVKRIRRAAHKLFL